jgi:hypothetical protein
MSAVHSYDEPILDAEDEGLDRASTMIERLDSRLAELTRSGYRIQWIEASEAALVTLFAEGGEEVIALDPDPSLDRAWYAGFEIRPTEKELIWIYLEGEFEGLSVHIVS